MIAIPARTREGEVLLTTIFGRCEQIALVDDQGRIEVRDNAFGGGRELAAWLLDQGVDTVIIRNIGANPYLGLRQGGARVFATRKNRAPVAEVVEDLRAGQLVEVTPDNMTDYVRAGQHRNQHEHAHEQGHGHHHH